MLSPCEILLKPKFRKKLTIKKKKHLLLKQWFSLLRLIRLKIFRRYLHSMQLILRSFKTRLLSMKPRNRYPKILEGGQCLVSFAMFYRFTCLRHPWLRNIIVLISWWLLSLNSRIAEREKGQSRHERESDGSTILILWCNFQSIAPMFVPQSIAPLVLKLLSLHSLIWISWFQQGRLCGSFSSVNPSLSRITSSSSCLATLPTVLLDGNEKSRINHFKRHAIYARILDTNHSCSIRLDCHPSYFGFLFSLNWTIKIKLQKKLSDSKSKSNKYISLFESPHSINFFIYPYAWKANLN